MIHRKMAASLKCFVLANQVVCVSVAEEHLGTQKHSFFLNQHHGQRPSQASTASVHRQHLGQLPPTASCCLHTNSSAAHHIQVRVEGRVVKGVCCVCLCVGACVCVQHTLNAVDMK